MSKSKKENVIPFERIASGIYLIRGQKVMLDADLADLYGVTTGNLNKAVQRNTERFPDDFMFQLTQEEFENLKFQIGIARSWGGRRTQPFVFTELGIAMLSSVLRSTQAVQVNMAIMRTFVRMREMLATHEDLARKVAEHDKHITSLYEHLQRLLTPPKSKSNPIGFIHPKDNDK